MVHDPAPQPEHDSGYPPHEERLEGLPPRTPSPPLGRGRSPSPPPAPRQSRREKRVPKKPGNVYGDRHPVEILKDPSGKKGGWKVRGPLPSAQENRPGPSRLAPDPPQPVGVDFVPPMSPTSSELDVERGLDQSEDELLRVCQDGGVPLLSFLLA